MHKKFIFIALAILLSLSIISIANATNIPEVVDPVNYPVVWTETVYNGTATAIATGKVVQWDFDTSNPTGTYQDDMCPYVKTADAAGDIWTAGVSLIHQGIAAYSDGQIIIKGPAYVKIGTTMTADDLVETNASGNAVPHDGDAVDESTLGICIKAVSVPYQGYGIVYVSPVAYDKD